jgi:hypothetical protein
MPDGAHRQGVVADDMLAAAHHVCSGGAARRRDTCGTSQPSIQSFNAAIELLQVVPVPELLDGTEDAGAQALGIGLRLWA